MCDLCHVMCELGDVMCRMLYEKLSLGEDSLEDMCNSFIENEDGFNVYIPFLINMDQGLNILREYGGSFFTDHQRELGDEMDILDHYCSPRARLVQYLEMFRDLCYSAQKQYLHGVSMVKVGAASMLTVSSGVTTCQEVSTNQRNSVYYIKATYIV